MKKKKISVPELYNSLEKCGITFNHHSKQEAMAIIDEHTNYYYKLASFRKNFEKVDGKYINCDFENLVDLASLDMHIRNYFLNMSLSTEHFIKTELTRLITANRAEDGYNIVAEFEQQYPSDFDKTLNKFKYTRYQKEMLDKHFDDFPVWVLMEHMDFTALMKLVQVFYYKYGKPRSLDKAVKLWVSSRYIRNSCAHNNTFIVDWFNESHTIKNNAAITSIANQIGIQRNDLRFAKINDLLATCVLLKTYASDGTLSHFNKEGQNLLERCLRHKETYQKVPQLNEIYQILVKLIDFISK